MAPLTDFALEKNVRVFLLVIGGIRWDPPSFDVDISASLPAECQIALILSRGNLLLDHDLPDKAAADIRVSNSMRLLSVQY